MKKLWSKISAKDQRGFTLIELIVAVAITGVIIIGLSSAVFQLVAGNAKNSNHTTAVRQVQAVGHWMSQDMLMADEVHAYYPDNPIDDIQTPEDGTDVLTVYWTEYTNWSSDEYGVYIDSVKHKVTYNLTEDNKLVRHHWRTENAEHTTDDYIGGFTILVDTYQVAQYIVLDEFNISPSGGGQYTLTVKATVGGFQPVSETRIYDIRPRPD